MKKLIAGLVVAALVVGSLWWPIGVVLQAIFAGANPMAAVVAQSKQLIPGEIVMMFARALGTAIVIGLPVMLVVKRLNGLRVWSWTVGVLLLGTLGGSAFLTFDIAQSGAAAESFAQLASAMFARNSFDLLGMGIGALLAGVSCWPLVRVTGDSAMIDLDEEWEATEKL